MDTRSGWSAMVTVRDGHAVLVRRAESPEDRAQLMKAAALLEMLGHPGVERLVGIESDSSTTSLTTRLVGERSLADHRPRRAASLAAILSALAQTVDDLHRAGVVHGPIDAHQVVLAGADRPVLCGFAAGRSRADVDASVWAGARSDDVRSLVALLGQLLDSLPDARGLAWRERRDRRRLRRVARDILDASHPEVSTLARRCAAVASGHRGAPPPAPVTFDARNGSALTNNRADRSRMTSTRRDAAPMRRRAGAASVIGATIGIALSSMGVMGIVDAVHARTARHPVAVATRTTVTGHSTSALAGCASTTSAPNGRLVDISGDGCPEHVRIEGNHLIVAGIRYTLGRPGDLIEVGDWDGDGAATPLLVRPRTGAVFLFRSWPSPGRELTARPVARVPGAANVVVLRHREGHDTVRIERTSGPPVPLDLAPASIGRTTP